MNVGDLIRFIDEHSVPEYFNIKVKVRPAESESEHDHLLVGVDDIAVYSGYEAGLVVEATQELFVFGEEDEKSN